MFSCYFFRVPLPLGHPFTGLAALSWLSTHSKGSTQDLPIFTVPGMRPVAAKRRNVLPLPYPSLAAASDIDIRRDASFMGALIHKDSKEEKVSLYMSGPKRSGVNKKTNPTGYILIYVFLNSLHSKHKTGLLNITAVPISSILVHTCVAGSTPIYAFVAPCCDPIPVRCGFGSHFRFRCARLRYNP